MEFFVIQIPNYTEERAILTEFDNYEEAVEFAKSINSEIYTVTLIEGQELNF